MGAAVALILAGIASVSAQPAPPADRIDWCNQRITFVVPCQVGTDTYFAANPRDGFQQR